MQVSLRDLDIIWEALHAYRYQCIPEGQQPQFDNEWSDICTIMSWIQNELGLGD